LQFDAGGWGSPSEIKWTKSKDNILKIEAINDGVLMNLPMKTNFTNKKASCDLHQLYLPALPNSTATGNGTSSVVLKTYI